MKRILSGILIGGLLVIILAVPVLAAYYTYITVVESGGNSYEELPIVVSRNTTQLAQYGLMSSTGLDSRVLTGDGYPLPHMLADNKVLFVSDLAAHETKTLVFYLGATSLSSFPIIVGYNGSFETPDDPDLELGYVMELLISGYFNAEASDVGHNILYKENAFRVWISATHTLKVAALNSTGDEQWSLQYSSFTTEEHTVYILANGLGCSLYVDDFVIPKDTTNLYDSTYYEISNTKDENMYMLNYYYEGGFPRTFYVNGMYWAFYTKSTSNTIFFYKTSVDGSSWSSEQSFSVYGTDTLEKWSVYLDNLGYVHIAYPDDRGSYASDHIRYRRGYPETNGTITWSADWQTVNTEGAIILQYHRAMVVADPSGYPMIMWVATYGVGSCGTDHYIHIDRSTTNNGIWTTGTTFSETRGNQCRPEQWLVQCPNSAKAYYLYARESGGYYKIVEGRYFNGNSWSGSADTILSSSSSLGYTRVCGVADNSDNFYLFWLNQGVIYMRIRYSDGSWSSVLSIATGSSPTVSYSTTKNIVYIFYLSGGYIMGKVLNLNVYTLSAEYIITAYSTGAPEFNGISATPYFEDKCGILYATFSTNSLATTAHACLWYPSEWNDNDYDWLWMQNNVTPYINDIQLAIDGVLQLEYKPASIILGTTLPDEENDHDGIITWGSNPSGVTATVGAFQSDVGGGDQIDTTVAPGMVGPQDMVGPTGQQDRMSEVGTLSDNPFYPLIKALSDNTSIPVQLWWLIIASIIVMIAMVVTYRYLPHQMIVALVGGGLSAFFYGMGIYPFWVPLIFGVMALAIILGERSPTV
jgi:hypothetical protein